MLTALDKAVAYCREHPDDVLAITRKHAPALASPEPLPADGTALPEDAPCLLPVAAPAADRIPCSTTSCATSFLATLKSLAAALQPVREKTSMTASRQAVGRNKFILFASYLADDPQG